MRLRLAMRLSEIDASKAKIEFEDAASGLLITAADQNFEVSERGGWDALTGVMSREWNSHYLTATLNTLYTGLGGIKTEDQVPDSLLPAIKPADYAGLKLDRLCRFKIRSAFPQFYQLPNGRLLVRWFTLYDRPPCI